MKPELKTVKEMIGELIEENQELIRDKAKLKEQIANLQKHLQPLADIADRLAGS